MSRFASPPETRFFLKNLVSHLWAMVLILVGQTLLLSFQLADQSMWTDEMHTARIVRSANLAEALSQIQLTENRPPLHYLALRAWARIVGPSEWGMRVFSIAAILLATALTFRLACDLTSRRAALWAALVSATAPTLLWHGRIMRGYAIAVPLAALSTLTFWRAWRRSRKSPRCGPKLVYLLVSSVLLFTDYLPIPVIGAHLLFLAGDWALRGWRRARGHAPILSVVGPRGGGRETRFSMRWHIAKNLVSVSTARRRGWWSWLVVLIGLLIVAAGLGLTMRWQSARTMAGTSPLSLTPSLQSLAQLPGRTPVMAAAVAAVLYSFSVGEAIFPWHPLAVPGTLAALVLGWLGMREMWHTRRDAAILSLLLILVPLVFISVVVFGTLLGTSMLVIAAARSLYLGVLLAIPLGAGLAARQDRRTCRHDTHNARLFLLAALLAARGVSLLNQTCGRHFLNPVHEVQVRELASQVARNVRPGDAVIFDERLPFDIYFRQLDAETPLFTPGPQHMGHALGAEVTPGSPVFLGQGEPFIPSIDPQRLRDYLRESQPPRLWLLVFHHEGHEHTVESEIGRPLLQAGLYQQAFRAGYAPQDLLYAQLRARLRPRPPIQYKAEIVLLTRASDLDKASDSAP